MKRARRFGLGSVAFDKRRRTWNLYKYDEAGKRHSMLIGTKEAFPTKSAAQQHAAQMVQKRLQQLTSIQPEQIVSELLKEFRKDRMPKRISTSRSYESRLKNHILPKWGECSILGLQARPVERWIKSLPLGNRSKGSIRAFLHQFWDYAIWAQVVPSQPNPISTVKIEDCSIRERTFQSLTIEQGRGFLEHLTREPFHTIALVCLCFGLRISEALALRWSSIDWMNRKLRIEASIVRQHLDKPKTRHSRKPLPISAAMLAVLQAWRLVTEFKAEEDWVFASPAKIGRQPWCDDQVRREFRKAAAAAGIELDPTKIFGTHSMRHSFRSWLDAEHYSLTVQQKMMRHGDIRTTAAYGDVVTDEMEEAQSKITDLALNSTQNSTRPC